MTDKEKRTYRIWRLILSPILEAGTKITIEGEEGIPEGASIIIANHRSDLDPLILSAEIERPINWLAGEYLFNIPLIKVFLKSIGAIPISKDKEVINQAFKKCKEVLKDKQLLGIFPEGWGYIAENIFKSPVGTFHTGFARLALECNVPVVPLVIIGLKERKEDFLIPEKVRKEWKFPERMETIKKMLIYREVHLKIGKPLFFKTKGKSFSYNTLKRITNEARDEIIDLIKTQLKG